MSRAGWLAASGLTLLLVASGVVAATTPTSAQWEQPFAVSAHIDETAAGRNLEATVHHAFLADEVSAPRWKSTDGSVWLVVDASVAGVVSEQASLGSAMVVIGERRYSASERPERTLSGTGLKVGIPTRGLLAFELPAGIIDNPASASAELRLAAASDPRLDSMIVVRLDLGTLRHHRHAVIDEPAWGRG